MAQVREINLIPDEVIVRDRLQARVLVWAVIIGMVIILLAAGGVMEKKRMGEVEVAIADLSEKKLAIEEKIKQMDILEEERDRLARKERVINTLLHKRSLSLLFSELEKDMNNNVWLTSFHFKNDLSLMRKISNGKGDGEWVETGYFIVKKDSSGNRKNASEETSKVSTSLKGIANSYKDLAHFLEQLSGTHMFSEVNLKRSMESTYKDRNVVSFEIETYLSRI
jgi:Tfp pilus assembly protein PilN